jgi:hypothetical protein
MVKSTTSAPTLARSRNHRNAPNRLRIANVGATRGDSADDWHYHIVLDWLLEHRPELAAAHWDHDHIDLHTGRDFLSEHGTYDVVIIHYVFGPRSLSSDTPADQLIALAQSKLHSPRNWRARLVETRAKLVFAIGGDTEVSTDYLRELDGYSLRSIRRLFGQASVYVKHLPNPEEPACPKSSKRRTVTASSSTTQSGAS